MPSFNRRKFLQSAGISILPALMPTISTFAGEPSPALIPPSGPQVKFFGDGEMFEPGDYINRLQQANANAAIVKDRYGVGGVVEALEKKFTDITGKERAIYMPSGTMANQLAIAVLSGENTKVFLQDTSHVYRDEADAAQSVFQKRLMPLASGQAFFTADQLKAAVENLPENEVFKTGIGAVSVECPVRRADGRMVPIEEIKKISVYCRSNNIKLHLDGARIYVASAWSGVSIKEYASFFDSIYISLYKYLGASAGAILCGDKTVIDKMPHLLKIHGGSMYGNWTNAAMALDRLNGVENRFRDARNMATKLFESLNKIKGIKVSALDNGTNIYKLETDSSINPAKMMDKLINEYGIRFFFPKDKQETLITVNETLLNRELAFLDNAFKAAVAAAKV